MIHVHELCYLRRVVMASRPRDGCKMSFFGLDYSWFVISILYIFMLVTLGLRSCFM